MNVFDLLAEELSIGELPNIFDVSDVEKAAQPLIEIPYYKAVELFLTYPTRNIERPTIPVFEACSEHHGKLIPGVLFHPLVAAIHQAFDDHRPLSLSPDMIWLLISQGFANHVNCHAEELRSHFVQHEGKVEIIVRRDDFKKGSPTNQWSGVFTEFSSSIRQYIGDSIHDLLVPTFSTTGLVEKAAMEIVLMDSMQSYFKYVVTTRCGIPQIQLEGTVDDWQQLLVLTKQLAQYKLEWWIDSLVTILEQFILASQGKPDRSFWKSIYKFNDGSGGANVTGWITLFFPYFKDAKSGKCNKQNPYFRKELDKTTRLPHPHNIINANLSEEMIFYEFSKGSIIEISQFPLGLAKAPFTWEYFDTKYRMEFLSGFVGVRQNSQNLFLRPEIGWIVRDAKT
jgi:Domain of unknown function (DUF4419)